MREFRGYFGIDLDHMVAGVLTLKDDCSFKLEVDGPIVPPEHVDAPVAGMVRRGGGTSRTTAHLVPQSLFGALEDGQPVTLLDALLEASFLLPAVRQVFRGSMSLFGALLRDERDDVAGIRWTWHLPAGAGLQLDRTAELVTGPVPGLLEGWIHDDGTGLQFLAARTESLRTLRREVQHNCTQLLGLWTAQPVPGVALTEVLVGSRWCVLHLQGGDPRPLAPSTFMPVRDLSVATFAAWIPLAHTVEPFPVLLNDPTEILQLDAQVLATAIEGLHRRLYVDGVRFEGMSGRSVERAARQARRTGVEILLSEGYPDEDRAHAVFRETLRHLNQMTYEDRAAELLEPVRRLVPSLFGPDLKSWIAMVTKIRNHQSHYLSIEFDAAPRALYAVVTRSCRWALVLRILLELSPGYDFRSNLVRAHSFALALATIDREELWPGFSALSEFRSSTSRQS